MTGMHQPVDAADLAEFERAQATPSASAMFQRLAREERRLRSMLWIAAAVWALSWAALALLAQLAAGL